VGVVSYSSMGQYTESYSTPAASRTRRVRTERTEKGRAPLTGPLRETIEDGAPAPPQMTPAAAWVLLDLRAGLRSRSGHPSPILERQGGALGSQRGAVRVRRVGLQVSILDPAADRRVLDCSGVRAQFL
jgi:hypothetical protein